MGSQRRPSSGNDYKIDGRMPPSSPTIDTCPQNRSVESPRPSTGSGCGCGCDGDDDVFDSGTYPYQMHSTPKIGTPQYGRAESYYESSMTNSYSSDSSDNSSLSFGSYRRPTSSNAPPDSISWESNSRAGSSKYDYESYYGQMSGWGGCASSYESDQSEGPPSYPSPPPPGRSVLPSWPDTPDGWKRMGHLGRFDKGQPAFDFENRHSLPLENSPPYRLPSYASGQTQKGSNFQWSVDENGKPSLVISSLEAVENMNQVHHLTNDTYNKLVQQEDMPRVMFFNSGQRQIGALGEWAKYNFIKQAAELTRGSNKTLGAVDCVIEKDLKAKQNVSTFPFFKMCSKGYLLNHAKGLTDKNSEGVKKYPDILKSIK